MSNDSYKILTDLEWKNLDPLLKSLSNECYLCNVALRTYNKKSLPKHREILLEIDRKLKDLKKIKQKSENHE